MISVENSKSGKSIRGLLWGYCVCLESQHWGRKPNKRKLHMRGQGNISSKLSFPFPSPSTFPFTNAIRSSSPDPLQLTSYTFVNIRHPSHIINELLVLAERNPLFVAIMRNVDNHVELIGFGFIQVQEDDAGIAVGALGVISILFPI